jgi:hypothetical protein
MTGAATNRGPPVCAVQNRNVKPRLKLSWFCTTPIGAVEETFGGERFVTFAVKA